MRSKNGRISGPQAVSKSENLTRCELTCYQGPHTSKRAQKAKNKNEFSIVGAVSRRVHIYIYMYIRTIAPLKDPIDWNPY